MSAFPALGLDVVTGDDASFQQDWTRDATMACLSVGSILPTGMNEG